MQLTTSAVIHYYWKFTLINIVCGRTPLTIQLYEVGAKI